MARRTTYLLPSIGFIIIILARTTSVRLPQGYLSRAASITEILSDHVSTGTMNGDNRDNSMREVVDVVRTTMQHSCYPASDPADHLRHD
ncbi:unnamed protein product [Amoebophrya sp. A25]|nr:unnamed protein product [Amoebophrya sp. A25]|eukprot:GSA25T00025533001.1